MRRHGDARGITDWQSQSAAGERARAHAPLDSARVNSRDVAREKSRIKIERIGKRRVKEGGGRERERERESARRGMASRCRESGLTQSAAIISQTLR